MMEKDFISGNAAPEQKSSPMLASKGVWIVFAVALAVAAAWGVWRYGMTLMTSRKSPEEPNRIAISADEYQPSQILLNEKKYEESRRAALSLLAKYPNDINTLQIIGSSYLRQGIGTGDTTLIEKAGETFERILMLFPQHIGAISDLATVKRLQEKYDEGIVILEKARRDFPFAESLETDLALMRAEARKAKAR